MFAGHILLLPKRPKNSILQFFFPGCYFSVI
jgi:hypothetical protein